LPYWNIFGELLGGGGGGGWGCKLLYIKSFGFHDKILDSNG
jgi:hypothetical protein